MCGPQFNWEKAPVHIVFTGRSDMAFSPWSLVSEAERRVLAGDISGVVALMDATVTFSSYGSPSVRAGLWPVWTYWRKYVVCGVLCASVRLSPEAVADVFGALLQYRSPHGDMFGLAKGAKPGQYLLTWGEQTEDADLWGEHMFGKVVEAWMVKAARWSPGRVSWLAAVVC